MNARTFNPDGCYVFPRAGKSVALPPIYYDFDTTDSGREAQNWPIKHFFRCWPVVHEFINFIPATWGVR